MGHILKVHLGKNHSFQMVSSRMSSPPPELGWIKGEKQADKNSR